MKLFFSLVLIISGWFIGGRFADEKKNSFSELCGIIHLLEEMKHGIAASRMGLYDIFDSFFDISLEKCGFIQKLRSGRSLPAGKVWSEALESLSVSSKEKEMLYEFGETLGLLDMPTQLNYLERCISELEEIKRIQNAKLAEKIKSFRLLGLLGGCMIAIILY